MSLIKFWPAAPAILLIASCGGGHKAETAKAVAPAAPVAVKTVAIAPVEWEDVLEVPGTVRARTVMTVTARAMGYVIAMRAQTGDRVTAGQTLVELDAKELQTAIQAAKAGLEEARQGIPEVESAMAGAQSQVKLAQTTLKRMKDLLDKRSVSQQEYDEAEARARVAESGLAMVQAKRRQLDQKIRQAEEGVRGSEVMAGYTTVKAPFNGRVTARRAEPGTLASPGMPLLELEQEGAFRFEAAVEESRLKSIKPGQAVTVKLDAVEQPLAGRVAEIVPSVDEASRTFIAKINLPGNPVLRSGLFGRAAFSTGARRNVLVAPQAAVETQGQLQSVWVAEGGTARTRLVRLGAIRDGEMEVLSGLQPGERVIHPRPAALADGARVEAQP